MNDRGPISRAETEIIIRTPEPRMAIKPEFQQSETPGRTLPAITEKTGIRTNLGTLIILVASAIAAALWAEAIHRDVQELKRDVSRISSFLFPEPTRPPTASHGP